MDDLLILKSLTFFSWQCKYHYFSDGAMTLSQIKDSMFNEEIRRKDMGSSISQFLVIEIKERK